MKKAIIIVLIILLGLSFDAFAASIRSIIYSTGSHRVLVIEGTIEKGDADKFIKIVKDNQGKISTVYIFSPGGNFYEAMKIGRAMRALELGSVVPMCSPSGVPIVPYLYGDTWPKPNDPKNLTCASAGFFIHIGGVSRSGTYLSVHRPYFQNGEFGELSEIETKKAFEKLQNSASAYMLEMGVPQHIQEEVLGTPSDQALILDEKTVKTYFLGDLPYRHEWLKNKCSRLLDEEAKRLKKYSQILWRNPNGQLPKDQEADFRVLRGEKKKERDCRIAINKQSRINAYEKYFRIKSSDYANYNFSKWSNASNYLGKSFDELLSKEGFNENEKLVGTMTFIERSATATTPYLSLHDSPYWPVKLKQVTSVTLISDSNPSGEFTIKLVKSLEEAWGEHIDGNGSSEWIWKTDKFWATLKHTSRAADRSYLALEITERHIILPKTHTHTRY